MVKIYTSPSCSSCKKAKKWMDSYGITYTEKQLVSSKLTKEDIFEMLLGSENGFEDIISKRSKIIKENKLDLYGLKVKEMVDFIINEPSVLRRPIILKNQIMQVGYNDQDIRVFLPKEQRKKLVFNKEFKL